MGTNYSAETWKTEVWLDMDRPEVIVYEDTTARSDHASFQDNLGAVTIGFGGLVDGYRHCQTCDALWKRWNSGWIPRERATERKIPGWLMWWIAWI